MSVLFFVCKTMMRNVWYYGIKIKFETFLLFFLSCGLCSCPEQREGGCWGGMVAAILSPRAPCTLTAVRVMRLCSAKSTDPNLFFRP